MYPPRHPSTPTTRRRQMRQSTGRDLTIPDPYPKELAQGKWSGPPTHLALARKTSRKRCKKHKGKRRKTEENGGKRRKSFLSTLPHFENEGKRRETAPPISRGATPCRAILPVGPWKKQEANGRSGEAHNVALRAMAMLPMHFRRSDCSRLGNRKTAYMVHKNAAL